MHIHVTSPEVEGIIADRVARGVNSSPDDVLREAVHNLVARDRDWNAYLLEIDHKIQEADDAFEAGQSFTKEELLRHAAERRKAFLSISQP